MSRRTLVIAIVALAIGAGLGSLLTFALMRSNRPGHPLAMSAAQFEAAQERADLVKASVLLRSVAQGCLMQHDADRDWTLPESAFDLIDQLIASDMLAREYLDTWPGHERRPAGEPPFFIVGTIGDLADRDRDAVLLYEHPAHHPGGGGSIVYADTRTETLERAAFAAAIERVHRAESTPR